MAEKGHPLRIATILKWNTAMENRNGSKTYTARQAVTLGVGVALSSSAASTCVHVCSV